MPRKHVVCAPRRHRRFVVTPPKKTVFLDDPADIEQALIQSFYDHASRVDQACTADAEDDGAAWYDSDANSPAFSSSDNETDFELEAHDDNESKNKCRDLTDRAATPIVDEPPCFVGVRENGEHAASLKGEHEPLLLHTPGMGAVVMASSWLQRSERHPERTLYDYGRGAGPNHDALATSLRRIYPTAQSVDLFCSGTAAIAGIIDAAIASDIDGDESDAAAACSAESVVIVHKELYGGTERLLEHLATTRRGFTFAIADLNDAEWVDQEVTAVALRGARVCLFYAESCSNPSGHVLDTRALAALRDRLLAHVPIVVDNSWLSMLCNPLAQGADAIVESLTKHVGSGHLVAGMAAFAPTLLGAALARRTRQHAEATGQHVSPFDAWLAESNVTTLAWRIDTASACCLAAARFLEAHPCIERVIYPGLSSHPDAVIARRVMRTRADGDLVGPTVLLFCVRLDAAAATRMIDSSPLLCYTSSYGKPWPLFDPHVAEGAADYYDTRAHNDEHAAEPCSWVRMAAGYSVAADALVAELDRLLRAHVAARSL